MNRANAHYLRTINNKTSWTKYLSDGNYKNYQWIKYANDYPASVIANDLKAINNEISLYYIEGDNSNLNRVLAALGANRDDIGHLDYTLIPLSVLRHKRFNIVQSHGETPDNVINENFHWDIIEITGPQLARLGKVILDEGIFPERVNWQTIKRLIIKSFQENHLKKTQLKEKILNKIKDSVN